MSANGKDEWLKVFERPAKLTPEEVELRRDLEWALLDPDVQDHYPDKYVAAHRRRVVAAGIDEGQVLEEAQRVTGLPQHLIAVVYIHSPENFAALG